MSKLKNKIITWLLKKDRLVAVPLSWQNEYVKMAGEVVQRKATIAQLITEYNDLLKDYFNAISTKELLDYLKDGNIQFKTTMSKQELANLAYEGFRMTIEKN